MILQISLITLTIISAWVVKEVYFNSSPSNSTKIEDYAKTIIEPEKKNRDDTFFERKYEVNELKPKFSVELKESVNSKVKRLDSRFRSLGAMSAKFRSLVPSKLQIWYDDGREGIKQGYLQLGQETSINTYVGHTFFFTDFYNKENEIARITMNSDQVFYVIEDPSNPPPKELKESTQKELDFMSNYYNQTGIPWRHYYGLNGPRDPPMLFMWPANTVGEVHEIKSLQGYWKCKGPESECKSPNPLDFQLEVISTKPKAFLINNFLSEVEINEILNFARPTMSKSSVGDTSTGAFESDTRTSKNTWVQRSSSPIIDTLFRRAADILQIDEGLLDRYHNAEDLQVVHYYNGEKYDSHHDWGVSGYPQSRYITLLLYLNDMASPNAGGETAFPKAADGNGIKIHPGKGNAVLFYNLLEDGNGDDLSLHAALPVIEGEKWLANFWVWDPKKKD